MDSKAVMGRRHSREVSGDSAHEGPQDFQWLHNGKSTRKPSSGLGDWVAASCVAEENATEHPVVLLHTRDVGAMAHAARLARVLWNKYTMTFALNCFDLPEQVFGHSLVLAATGVAAYAGWRQLSYCYHLVAASGSRI